MKNFNFSKTVLVFITISEIFEIWAGLNRAACRKRTNLSDRSYDELEKQVRNCLSGMLGKLEYGFNTSVAEFLREVNKNPMEYGWLLEHFTPIIIDKIKMINRVEDNLAKIQEALDAPGSYSQQLIVGEFTQTDSRKDPYNSGFMHHKE